MNNYSTNNQIRQFELEEAKKRMGTSGASSMTNTTGGYGMTNTAGGNAMTNTTGGANTNYTNVSAQSQLKNSEKIKAQEDMNKNTMY